VNDNAEPFLSPAKPIFEPISRIHLYYVPKFFHKNYIIVAMCSEALKPCKTGAQCFSDADRCDNVSKCDDGTDEEGCCKYVE
jgi:hypothetical protein